MFETLAHLFSTVCGQNPDHTWAPGDFMLPLCQRCTGLYAGAAAAAILLAWLRPRLTGRFLGWHGLFILVMAPFGFHWVEHGGMVRTMTGVLFGAGVVCFLWVGVSRGANPKFEIRNSKQIRNPKLEGGGSKRLVSQTSAEISRTDGDREACLHSPTTKSREASWSAVVLYRFRGRTETGKRESQVAADLPRQSARGQAHSKTLRADVPPGGLPECDAPDGRIELNNGEPPGVGNRQVSYFCWIAIALVAIPVLAHFGGRAAALMLTALGVIGATVFTLLILVNLFRWLGAVFRVSIFEFPSIFGSRISNFFPPRS